MNLPAFALKNKTIVVVVALLLMLLGVNVFLTAPRKEDPQFTIRDAWIVTIWPGATTRQVEKLVADPIEDAMSGVEAVRKIDTTSYVGYCVTQISIQDQYSDAGAVWDKVRRELTLIESDLPAGCMSPILDDHASQATVFMLCLYQDPHADSQKRYSPGSIDRVTFSRAMTSALLSQNSRTTYLSPPCRSSRSSSSSRMRAACSRQVCISSSRRERSAARVSSAQPSSDRSARSNSDSTRSIATVNSSFDCDSLPSATVSGEGWADGVRRPGMYKGQNSTTESPIQNGDTSPVR